MHHIFVFGQINNMYVSGYMSGFVFVFILIQFAQMTETVSYYTKHVQRLLAMFHPEMSLQHHIPLRQ